MYFSRIMPPAPVYSRPFTPSPFQPLGSLRPDYKYQLLNVENRQGLTILTLRGNEEGTFQSLFSFPWGAMHLFRAALAKNGGLNGSSTPMFLEHTGEHAYGMPVLVVSGRGFTQRLG